MAGARFALAVYISAHARARARTGGGRDGRLSCELRESARVVRYATRTYTALRARGRRKAV